MTNPAPAPPPATPRKIPWRTIGLVALGFLVLTGLGILFGRSVGRADQHNRARYGLVVIRLAPEWTPSERARMEAEFPHLDRLGPTFQWNSDNSIEPPGPSQFPGVFRAVVYRGDWGPDGCATRGAGYYDVPTGVIWIDPVCTPGETLATTLAHELGHALGMGHICRSAGESGTFDCSPVGYDRASIMNPTLMTDPGHTGAAEDPNAPPPIDPSFQDLAEFRRVFGRARLRPDASR